MKSYTDDIKRRSELLARVLNGEEFSKADAADILGVSEITINRYIHSLREDGINIYSKKNKLIVEEFPTQSTLVSIASDYIPLKLNSDVFHKQVKAYSQKDKKEFFPKLILIAKAVDEGLVINLVYKRFYDNKTAIYELHPVRLINNELNWILQGVKKGEDEIKSFYLSRIKKLKLTDNKFRKLPLYQKKKGIMEIELKFDPRVRDEILDKIWFEFFELEEADNFIILKTKQPITNKLASWCISWWDSIEILKPVELKKYISEMIEDYKSKNQ
ncbi:MAG TPA: WYL domain-containing transcriptional regulator [Ignavibacteriaceae bacterium]|nr:WYL domain-containing transcriptional regulator [Ignavibacteriaceae bacterium]